MLQNYNEALKIDDEIMEEALSSGSYFGEYTALHAKATILLQKHDYDNAEKEFIKAVDFRHRHFPAESAGDDL